MPEPSKRPDRHRALNDELLTGLIEDGTTSFARRYLPPKHRTPAQMVDAANQRRYEDLAADFEAFLAEGSLELWPIGHSRVKEFDVLASKSRTRTRQGGLSAALHPFLEQKGPEFCANTMLWLLRRAIDNQSRN